jgi:hypothetical protein
MFVDTGGFASKSGADSFLALEASERFCRQRRSWSTPVDGFPNDRRDAGCQWFGRESSNVENASEIRSRFRHFENKNCLHPLSGEHIERN